MGEPASLPAGLYDLREISEPYPGLRPFESWETEIFFGREAHTERLLEILRERRFLAVIGPSGSGKSSLVRAGLLPQLPRGRMGTGTHWHVAVLRPGNEPVRRLARALLQGDALGPALVGEECLPPSRDAQTLDVALLEAELRRGPLGLVAATQAAERREAQRTGTAPPAHSLLVLVDQFEEIFTHLDAAGSARRSALHDEADAFVNLLLAASTARDAHIFVVLTMRTDFLGQCVRFLDLPDAINRAQYLTPRLKREEVERAIVGPARHFGGDIEPNLVNELINAVGSDPDQLPILQHALSRMWGFAGERALAIGPDEPLHIDARDFARAGGVRDALSQHADKTLAALAERQEVVEPLLPVQQRAREIFLAITEQRTADGGGQTVRRPQSLARIAQWAQRPVGDFFSVVSAFAHPQVNFVHIGGDLAGLGPDTVVDISHEALIRQWQRMREWVAEEAERAADYRRLRASALAYGQGRAGAALLSGAALARSQEWLAGKCAAAAHTVAADAQSAGGAEAGAEATADGAFRPGVHWAQRYALSDDEDVAKAEFALVQRYIALSAQEAQRQAEQAQAVEQSKHDAEQQRREREAADQRAEIQRERARRQRGYNWALVVLLALVGLLGIGAYRQSETAKAQTAVAECLRRSADERSLVAQAKTLWFPIELDGARLSARAMDALLDVARLPQEDLARAFMERVFAEEAFADRFVRAPGAMLAAAVGPRPTARARLLEALDAPPRAATQCADPAAAAGGEAPVAAAMPPPLPAGPSRRSAASTSALARAILRLALADPRADAAPLAAGLVAAAAPWRNAEAGDDARLLAEAVKALRPSLPRTHALALVAALQAALPPEPAADERGPSLLALAELAAVLESDQRLALLGQLRELRRAPESGYVGAAAAIEPRLGVPPSPDLGDAATGTDRAELLDRALGRVLNHLDAAQTRAMWNGMAALTANADAQLPDLRALAVLSAKLDAALVPESFSRLLANISAAGAAAARPGIVPADANPARRRAIEGGRMLALNTLLRRMPPEHLLRASTELLAACAKQSSGSELVGQFVRALSVVAEGLPRADLPAMVVALRRAPPAVADEQGVIKGVWSVLLRRFPQADWRGVPAWMSSQPSPESFAAPTQPWPAGRPTRGVAAMLKAIAGTEDPTLLGPLGAELAVALARLPEAEVAEQAKLVRGRYLGAEDEDQKRALALALHALAARGQWQDAAARRAVLAPLLDPRYWQPPAYETYLDLAIETPVVQGAAVAAELQGALLRDLMDVYGNMTSAQDAERLGNKLVQALRAARGDRAAEMALAVARLVATAPASRPNRILRRSPQAPQRAEALAVKVLRDLSPADLASTRERLLDLLMEGARADVGARIAGMLKQSLSQETVTGADPAAPSASAGASALPSPVSAPASAAASLSAAARAERAALARGAIARLASADRAQEVEWLGSIVRACAAGAAADDEWAHHLFDLMKYPAQDPTALPGLMRELFAKRAAPGADAGYWALVVWAGQAFPKLVLDRQGVPPSPQR